MDIFKDECSRTTDNDDAGYGSLCDKRVVCVDEGFAARGAGSTRWCDNNGIGGFPTLTTSAIELRALMKQVTLFTGFFVLPQWE